MPLLSVPLRELSAIHCDVSAIIGRFYASKTMRESLTYASPGEVTGGLLRQMRAINGRLLQISALTFAGARRGAVGNSCTALVQDAL